VGPAGADIGDPHLAQNFPGESVPQFGQKAIHFLRVNNRIDQLYSVQAQSAMDFDVSR
jgi:hypothetical protein